MHLDAAAQGHALDLADIAAVDLDPIQLLRRAADGGGFDVGSGLLVARTGGQAEDAERKHNRGYAYFHDLSPCSHPHPSSGQCRVICRAIRAASARWGLATNGRYGQTE